MKTLTTIAAAFLMIISLSSFAADRSSENKSSIEYGVKKYVRAITMGETEGLEDVLSQSLTYRFARGNEVKSFGKADLMKFMKEAGKAEQNCSTAYQILESESGESIVLIDQKYADFTKLTRLTLQQGKDGWEISKIASWFE
ncbi:nuclear transport factor 2 family protein [Pedobacter sp. SYSU D00535]|uniref:nuclear transport factor 2 family protein n=1 Tax=Pedobacter sp. SYSU D00535 TaxID=2810308 RepID=UPI001A973886|nr:nuclear transport factor 2 family protein [Pedobacter sp. SYSU D00535]